MINKKKGPGRPQKKFIPPVKAKQAGPGRPKKVVKTYNMPTDSLPSQYSRRGFVSKNILHAPKKDNIILLMFVLSLCVFIFSLYITVMKGQKAVEVSAVQPEIPITDIQTGDVAPTPGTGQTQLSGLDAVVANPPAQGPDQVIGAFYDAFNVKNLSSMYSFVDKTLKNEHIFQTYYSNNRLTQFLSHAVKGVQVQNLQLKLRPADSQAQMVTYTLAYTRDDGKTYSEDRSAVLIRRGENYKIGKLMCTTIKCSQLPFFNIPKYVK